MVATPPASFPDPAARDRYYDALIARRQGEADAARAAITKQCTEEGGTPCGKALAAVDTALGLQVDKAESQRQAARLAAPTDTPDLRPEPTPVLPTRPQTPLA